MRLVHLQGVSVMKVQLGECEVGCQSWVTGLSDNVERVHGM